MKKKATGPRIAPKTETKPAGIATPPTAATTPQPKVVSQPVPKR